MSTIDSRIVTMKFDNASFQKGVASTMDALSKLKTAVSGIGGYASKGFGAVGAAASKANLAPLGAQADEVGNRFTAMSVVAITALATIAHSAIQSGLSFAKSFTFGPIMDGLSEYQTNLQSIQTIQANTDRPLTEITHSLDELNRYSDRTIYNFSEMAKNIGTFTAAGVDLKTATSAIKGIANMAALSGSTSAQASSAMYQLSQALASGKVSLMDWNSVVNAGMGGKKLQTALAQTAVAMGELEANAISGTAAMDTLRIHGASFRESLSADSTEDPWLSSEVLKVTLASLDGRFSKLALSTEKLEDGTLKYKDAAEVTAAMDAKRNELAKQGTVYNDEQWKSLLKLSDSSFLAATQVKTLGQVMQVAKETLASGWSATFRNIFGDFGEAKKTFTEMSGFINDGINAMALRRNNMLAKWNAMGGRDVLIESFKNAFKALSHVIQPIQRAFRDIFPRTTAKNLLAITEAVERFTKGLVMQGHTMHDVRAIFKAIFGVIAVGIEIVKGVVHYFTSLIGLLSGGTGGVLDFSGSIAEVISGLTDWILKGDYIARFFDKIIAGRAALLGPIIEKFSDLLKVLAGFVRIGVEKAIDGITVALQFISPILADIVDWLSKAGAIVQDKMVAAFKALAPVVQVVYAWLKEMGVVVQDKMVAAFDKLVPVFGRIKTAIADAFGSLSGIGGIFGSLASVFDIGDATDKAAHGIDKVKEALSGADDGAEATQTVFSSLWGWLKNIGGVILNVGQTILSVLGGIGKALYAEVAGLFQGGAEYGGSIASFLGGIVSSLVDAVSGMSFNEFLIKLNALLATGILASIWRMMHQFGGIFKDARGVFRSLGGVLDQATSGIKTMQNAVRAQMLLNIAIAIGILAAALWVLSKIPQDKLGLALGAVTALLLTMTGALVVLTKTMPGPGLVKDAIKMGTLTGVLIALGVAMLLMAAAVYIFSKMDQEELKQGLMAVGAVLAGITIAAFAMEKSGGSGALLRASVAIGIMAVSLAALAATIKLFSMLDTGMLVEGGAKIAALLIGLGIAMQFLPAQNVIAGAIALGVVSVAMLVMVKSLKKLAKLSAGDSIQSVLTLAATLAILIVAMNAAQSALPGAIALVVIAGGLVILAQALQTLGEMSLWEIIKSLLALVGVFAVLGLAAVVLAPVIPLIILLGAAIALLGVGLLAGGAGVYLFGAGLEFLARSGRDAITVLIDAINQFLDAIPGFFDRLTAAIPAIGRLFRKIISEGLKTLRAAIPDFIKTGFKILMGFLTGIRDNLGEIILVAVDILVKLVRGLGENAWRIIEAAVSAVLKFINGIARGIRKYSQDFIEAGANIANALLDAVKTAIENGTSAVRAALISMVARAAIGVGVGAVSSVVGNVTGGGGSSSGDDGGGGSWGTDEKKVAPGSLSEPVEEDLSSEELPKAAEKSAKGVLDIFKKTLGGLSDVVSSNMDINPSITPVLDLSDVEKNASKMGSIFGSKPLSATVSYQQASDIAQEQQAISERLAELAESPSVTEIKFEQHNNSPKALSSVEIYRNTRNQLSLAKEALKV